MNPARFERFCAAFLSLLEKEPNKAPTPIRLNAAMGRKPLPMVDGEMTRWRNFLLRECGFKQDRPPVGRWKRVSRGYHAKSR